MGVGVTRRGYASLAVAVAVTLAILSACPARAQTALKLTLDGRIEPPSAPFLVALEKGYFKSEGLDVSIEPSAGNPEAMSRVASGAFDVGVGDINALIRYRDQNSIAGAFKVVFVVNNRPSYAVIGRRSRGVSAPADIDGKRLGAPAAEPATAAWPAFAKINGIDAAKVRMLNVGIPVREPMLAAGEVDAVTGASFGTPITLREKGVPEGDITTMLMAAYGVELYGNSIFVNARLATEKPDAVKAFLRAFLRGLKDTIAAPAAAVPSVLRRANGGQTRELELERLSILIRDSIVTPEVRNEGLGGVNLSRLGTAIEQIGMGYTFKNKPNPGDVFDPSFLPPDADRKVP